MAYCTPTPTSRGVALTPTPYAPPHMGPSLARGLQVHVLCEACGATLMCAPADGAYSMPLSDFVGRQAAAIEAARAELVTAWPETLSALLGALQREIQREPLGVVCVSAAQRGARCRG